MTPGSSARPSGISRLRGASRRILVAAPVSRLHSEFQLLDRASQEPLMIVRIIAHTPAYVFVLLGGLVVLGLMQIRTREVSRTRVVVLPVAMLLLSVSGVLGAFTQPILAVVAWAIGLGLVIALASRALAIRQASWSAATGRFRVPGSWLPLVLILSLFVFKYTAAVVLALNPPLASDVTVTVSLSALYGAFSGLFWGRARSLIVLTRAGLDGAQAA
jgi:hypothetical protein